ncbi:MULTISPECIES: SRPBCC family protein [unclassified Lysobacter]|uniref:SRPBCC family protein n=1 Tax=unclassified Lysobacter TaxID=2635362 RepID=UPI001BEB5E94|nr:MULTISPECIES: SRPBCC family protein [unclassified Lysobacter]MBT2746437.1 SRPBCC family protein [Lysobacter sp. ISL-42]MBT2753206.1 SRPBCC family protein [Lysobacter sp. ISL-50]MBT2776619.1 SRPBCC family protein [Lysobacter sp. ISL-54]MBT2783336.1 SRPBCC family protein [Lysobacter sp. ISL-52]
MKTLLKGLLYLVVLLAAVFVVGGFLLPSSSHVERSITIDRPPGEVHAMLDSYKRFNEWSPWFEIEPTAKYAYSGPESGVGAAMSWEGAKVGKGSQRITESVPQQKVVNALDFDGTQATGIFGLQVQGAGTRVTWTLESEHGNNLVSRWFGLLLLDSMVGKDYEKGLAKLKLVLESEPR